VVGLDISGPMLLKARKKRVAGAQFLQADAGIIPFGDSTFDVVAAITVLEFVPQPGEVLKEMARCARAGGRLLVGVLNRWSYLGLSRRIWGSSTFRAARFFSRPELKRLLSPHGRVRVDSVACILPWRRAVWAAHFIDRLATVMALPLGDFLVGEVRL
jgi:SAM-dependent methyltransferase